MLCVLCMFVLGIFILPLQTNFLAESSAKALGEKLAQFKHTWLQLYCADCWTQVYIQRFFLVRSLTSSIDKLRSPWATCQNSTESPIATEMLTLSIYLISCSCHGHRYKQYKREIADIPHAQPNDIIVSVFDFRCKSKDHLT